METKAVLTGDLIGSTDAGSPAVDRAIDILADSARHISQWAGADTRFTRFRGDGWQLYLDFPGLVLTACVYLSARLRASNCGLTSRISVGLGPVDRLGTTNLADASGDAFTRSGHGLDHIKRSDRLVMDGGGAMAGFFRGIFAQTAFQVSRWSHEQAEAVALALDREGRTQQDLAKDLGISRQALLARLNSAGFHALDQTLNAFEGYDFPHEQAR